MTGSPTWEIRQGHVVDVLKAMPAGFVQCVVTSPPYWGLRDYGLPPLVWDDPGGCEHEWKDRRWYTEQSAAKSDGSAEAFSEPGAANAQRLKEARWRQDSTCSRCPAWRGSLGLEPTPDLYVQHLVGIFREVRRVLRDDGTCWINLGDCYASGDRGGYRLDAHRWEKSEMQSKRADRGGSGIPLAPNRLPQIGLKDKDLVGMPWRVAFALQADGWWLRSDIIWSKPNPMPESVTDRPTKSHEYLFLLSKAATYYYDSEAIKEPLAEASVGRLMQPSFEQQTGGPKDYAVSGQNVNRSARRSLEAMHERLVKQGAWDGRHEGYKHLRSAGRNRRTVWEIATAPFPEAHFATFPPALVTPCILAGTSEKGACSACGAAWERVIETNNPSKQAADSDIRGFPNDGRTANPQSSKSLHRQAGGVYSSAKEKGWRPTCACGRPESENVACRVLDPFAGSGTVGLVALQYGRSFIGIELKPEYVEMARKRIVGDAPLLNARAERLSNST